MPQTTGKSDPLPHLQGKQWIANGASFSAMFSTQYTQLFFFFFKDTKCLLAWKQEGGEKSFLGFYILKSWDLENFPSREVLTCCLMSIWSKCRAGRVPLRGPENPGADLSPFSFGCEGPILRKEARSREGNEGEEELSPFWTNTFHNP